MQRLRDNPECADQEFEAKKATDNKGLSAHLTYDVNEILPHLTLARV